MQQYVPLHVHTEYSLLDGATRVKELLKHAKDNNMPAVAITDHGVMYGAMELYRLAKEAGVKPVIGCEFYIIDGDIKDKEKKQDMYHLVLIAKNNEGYKNLVKLASIAHVDGFYYKPRINHELLEKYSNGLICLSACIGGEVPKLILKGFKEDAIEKAKYYKKLFGEDYYIEIQDHGLDEQKRTNPDLIKIAKELDIELVITNDSHYTKREDAHWHDILLCLQTNANYNDANRFRFSNNEFYIKTVDELRQSFKWLDNETFDKAIENTVKVAEKCNLIINMGRSVLPNYEIPANHTIESYLSFKVREGVEKRYGEITPDIEKRYKFELEIIESMGFSAYFLIVWDFINYARENNIPVGPGRGSAAGSIVAYSLGITDIDPIEHNLLFERFLNPERVSMPDVDIDFCIEKRGQVIDYVTQKYGEDRVCQIITFGTLAARAAVKGVARVMEIPFAEANKLAQLIPMAPGMTIDKALEESPEFKEIYDNDKSTKELIDTAKSIEGIKFNIGTHAAGVIISKEKLDEIVPVQRSKEGIVITEYPMADLEKLGLLKMDFLGLRNLTMINKTLVLIKERTGLELEINKIPLDDSKTYELLTKGDTDGVFQLESAGMKKLVRDLKPNVFEDLGALVALFRPGPLNSGMVKDFVERKHGRQKVEYPHPTLETILKDTYGTIVYQEQIMQIAQVLSGYSLGQADILRRAMGKKKAEEMEKQRAGFLEGAKNNNVDPKIAEKIFDTMTEFAAYCFNKSHSAAYAFVAYQTAYLKAHYPVEYISALLSSVGSDQEKIQLYIAEGQKLGIKVLPPSVNASCADFTPDGGDIRFGLASIKNVGAAVVEEIVKARQENPFESFYDFCSRVDIKCLNKRTLESLIKAGAFSTIEKSRKQLLENLDAAIGAVQRENDAKLKGQINLFAALSTSDSDAFVPNFELTGSDEEFADRDIQAFEKELLGFYVTSHPLSSIRQHLPFLTTHKVSDLNELSDNSYITICGLISSVRQIYTKNNKILKVGVIEDLTGSIEFVAFQKVLDVYNQMIETEQKVILSGKIQHRGDDEEAAPSIVVDTVKSVDNCNLVSLHVNKKIPFENIVYLKDLLIQYKGSDPVIFKMEENGSSYKVLANSNYWVNASNDLQTALKQNFKDALDIHIKSLDT